MSCPINNLAIRLANITAGNTWGGLQIVQTTDGNAFDSPLASVSMVWKDSAGTVGLTLTSASGITIDDANAYSYTVDSITTFPLAAGTWSWAIAETNSAGTKITRYAGTKTVTP